MLTLGVDLGATRCVRAPGDGTDPRDLEDETAAPRATREQLGEIAALLRSLEQIDPGTDWKARCREIIGVPGEQMTSAAADNLIRQLQTQLAELVK